MIGMLIDKLYFLAGAHHVDLRFAPGEDPKWLQDVRKGEEHHCRMAMSLELKKKKHVARFLRPVKIKFRAFIEPYRPIGLVKRSALATRSIEPYFDGLVQLPIMSDIWAYEPGCFVSILKILKNKNSFLFSNQEAVLHCLHENK
jgi:hypothetical protein